MDRVPASHRSLALLVLVVFAIRSMSFSRGNLNEFGFIAVVVVLLGLVPVLWCGGRWQGSSDTVGGGATWQVVLPIAYFYLFATVAGQHLLVFSPADWRPPLRIGTWSATLLALPMLTLLSGRVRDRVGARGQALLFCLPLVPAAAIVLLTPIISSVPSIDVFEFQMQSGRALVIGQNPYSRIFTGVYDGSDLYPSGAADSYPYPPLSLLLAVAGYWIGDVRWPLMACHIGAAALLFAAARHRRLPTAEAIVLGGLFFYLPHAPFVIEQSWTDPSVTLGLGAFSYLLARRREQAALWAAGATLALKQTMVLLLPLLWGLWRRVRVAALIAVFSIAAVTYGLFLLWDAGDLWNDVVTFHLRTPFRPRSLTLSAFLVYLGLPKLPSWMSLVGLVAGSVAGVVALRPGAAGSSPSDSGRLWRFFAALAFVDLLTLLLSKHAFMNYYYLAFYALVAALVWSRIADVEAARAGA